MNRYTVKYGKKREFRFSVTANDFWAARSLASDKVSKMRDAAYGFDLVKDDSYKPKVQPNGVGVTYVDGVPKNRRRKKSL